LTESLDQRVVVVIGGSSGIGYEIARQASVQGARLIIVGRNPAKLTAAADRLSGVMKTAVLDAHDETALENFFRGWKPSITLSPWSAIPWQGVPDYLA
jgi:NADP-dependent 3-hydroxy acid dehydrogenase YdfG